MGEWILRLKLACDISWWRFQWSERWTPGSITSLRKEVNTKSIQKEEFPKMRVGSLIHCFRPNCKVTASVLEPLYVLLLCLYQFEHLVLKSSRTTVRNGFWLLISSNDSCILFSNSSKKSRFALVIDIKKRNYIIPQELKLQKLSILVNNKHQ